MGRYMDIGYAQHSTLYIKKDYKYIVGLKHYKVISIKKRVNNLFDQGKKSISKLCFTLGIYSPIPFNW